MIRASKGKPSVRQDSVVDGFSERLPERETLGQLTIIRHAETLEPIGHRSPEVKEKTRPSSTWLLAADRACEPLMSPQRVPAVFVLRAIRGVPGARLSARSPALERDLIDPYLATP